MPTAHGGGPLGCHCVVLGARTAASLYDNGRLNWLWELFICGALKIGSRSDPKVAFQVRPAPFFFRTPQVWPFTLTHSVKLSPWRHSQAAVTRIFCLCSPLVFTNGKLGLCCFLFVGLWCTLSPKKEISLDNCEFESAKHKWVAADVIV